MKKILLVVFFLLSLFSLVSSYLEKVSEETEQFRSSILDSSKILVINEENLVDIDEFKKKEMIETLISQSEVNNINIFKSDIESEKNEFFAKINVNSKDIFEQLAMTYPKNESHFTVENKNLFSEKNKYVLKDFDQLYQLNFLSGRYIIQYKNIDDFYMFCENIEQKLNIKIEVAEDEGYQSNMAFFKILNAIIIITLILVILLYYFYNYKNNTIKSYFGYSNLMLVNDIYKSLFSVLLLLVTSSLMWGVFLLYKKIYYLHIFNLVLNFWLNNILFILISYVFISILVILSKKNWLSFKGKKVLLPVVIVGVVFTYTVIPLIVFGLSELVPLAKENFYLAATKKNNKKILNDYYYLPLMSAGIGMDQENLLVRSFQHHNQLFSELYKEDLLLFRMEDATRNRLNGVEYEEDYSSNEIWVTPNYLNELTHIYNLDNQKVNIDTNEKELLILVPEIFKQDIKEIKKYYIKSHDFYDYEVAEEFSDTKIEKKTKDIQFVYIKNNPKLTYFSINKQKLKNPIIRVLTPDNIQPESSVYADIILGQTHSFFVKDNGNLPEIIRNNDPYKEFPIQIKAYDYLMSTFQEELQLVSTFLVMLIGLILLYYVITYFLSGIFFTMYEKQFKLSILFGINLQKMLVAYVIIYLFPWLSMLFFQFSKEGLLLAGLIILGSIPLIFTNFKKVYRDIAKLE